MTAGHPMAAVTTIALVLGIAAHAHAQLTATERQQVLDRHNAERCAVSPAAKTMPALAWDDTLAQVAQAQADRCVFSHNPGRSTQYRALGGRTSLVGENIAAGTISVDALVQVWADEKRQWNYAKPRSSGAGHYTQMIWAATTLVGCGVAVCDSLARPGRRRLAGGRFLVCNYAPAGNYVGQRPYAAGNGANAACSAPGVTGPSRH